MGIRWRYVVSFTPRPLYSGERATGTHWIEGCVVPRTGLEAVADRKKSLSPLREYLDLGGTK